MIAAITTAVAVFIFGAYAWHQAWADRNGKPVAQHAPDWQGRAVPVVIIVLLLVWAVLATMALNKAKESNDTERAAYVDSVRADMLDRDMLIRTFYDSLAVQDHLLDSLRSIRMNPEVFHQEAAQKTDGASVDSLVNELEKSVQ
jgi:hypothetical protein